MSVCQAIPTDGMNFIGIGKLMFDTSGVEWNIPHLHFIVSKADDGIFEATNMEFILDASGQTAEESIQNLTSLIVHHITLVMSKENGYDLLTEPATSCVMEKYWLEYRKIEFSAARRGKDLGHNIEQRILAAIQSSFTNQLLKDITSKASEMSAEIIEDFKRKLNFRLTSILYTEKDAA